MRCKISRTVHRPTRGPWSRNTQVPVSKTRKSPEPSRSVAAYSLLYQWLSLWALQEIDVKNVINTPGWVTDKVNVSKSVCIFAPLFTAGPLRAVTQITSLCCYTGPGFPCSGPGCTRRQPTDRSSLFCCLCLSKPLSNSSLRLGNYVTPDRRWQYWNVIYHSTSSHKPVSPLSSISRQIMDRSYLYANTPRGIHLSNKKILHTR